MGIFCVVIIGSIISGVLYRLGGWSKGNTKFRDLGCPTVALVALWLVVGFKSSYWWAYLLTFLFSFGALCTYRYGLPKPKDYTWHYYLHGFMCGLAGLPLIWCGVPLVIILSRIVIVTIGMGFFSNLIDKDWLEEGIRGVLFIL